MPTSLDLYLPFDAGAGANVTEDNWRKMARFWLGTGPIAAEDNEMQVYADSTGMQVKVKTGKAFVRGHYGENTAEKTLAVTAAHATLGRIDLVVLRADFVNNRVEVDVIAGTAAASPAAPVVTQSTSIWEVALATVTVDAAVTTIAAGKVTDARVKVTPPSQGPLFARKTAIESVTSSTVLQNDDHLVLAVAANAIYQLEMILQPDGAAAADLKFQLVVPAGATFVGTAGSWDITNASRPTVYVDQTTVLETGVDPVTILPVIVKGILRVGATAGNLQLQWAQKVSNATATRLNIDSYLLLRRVA